MTQFIQACIDGLANGAVYASLALALVLVHRSTNVVNFAQGEMAMVATYLAWSLCQVGVPVLVSVAVAVISSFALGAVLHEGLVKRLGTDDELNVVILTLGVFLCLNGLATIIWSGTIKAMPSGLPDGFIDLGGLHASSQSLAALGVLVVELVVLLAIFKFTKIGLALRAAAEQPLETRLLGVDSSKMHMLGWGIAASLGAVAGALAAPRLFLEPHFMFGVLIYAFAAMVLGGIDSPGGAVVGGLVVGVIVQLYSQYAPESTSGLQIVIAPATVVLVLLVRPQGLFGREQVVRL